VGDQPYSEPQTGQKWDARPENEGCPKCGRTTFVATAGLHGGTLFNADGTLFDPDGYSFSCDSCGYDVGSLPLKKEGT